MTVKHAIFQSSSESWESLCDEATAFASSLEPSRLINISVAASGGDQFTGTGGKGLVIVWYWSN